MRHYIGYKTFAINKIAEEVGWIFINFIYNNCLNNL